MECEFIAHRINSSEQLLQTPTTQGVEIDLRDHGDRLILQHDPFLDGEDFSQYLEHYNHGTMILNIKSERVEHRVLELINAKGTVQNYFFLDCSYPMIRTLNAEGEHRIAVRYSEYEPIENALSLTGHVDWVWVDCFNRMPLDDTSYTLLSAAFKICIVSPELQGHPLNRIAEFAAGIRDYHVEAICTKRPDIWQQVLSPSKS